MSVDPGYEVLFLPWADVGRIWTIGPFELVPWNKLDSVPGPVKSYLDSYFARHVDHFGSPVKGIGILRHPAHDFEPKAYYPHEPPYYASHAFSFAVIGATVRAAVASNNPDCSPPTSNCYEIYRQNFRAGDQDVCVRSGGSRTLARIDAITFSQPWDLGSKACSPDEQILNGLGKMLTHVFPAEDRARIFRALEWFHVAHRSEETVSGFTKLVMMATAFEILFQIPEGQGKTKNFIDAVESRLTCLTTKSDTRMIVLKGGKKAGTTKSFTHTLPGWWANKFYDLRSRVVHGDELIPEQLRYDDWISHLIVADVVFFQCIAKELYDRQLIGDEIHKMKADPMQAIVVPTLEERLLGFDTHKTLKWIS